jgi:alpha-beta hydrolase superfamily lysophospholipase
MRPLWFGPDEAVLFGWLHQPTDSSARGGAVLCPPLGIETVSARYAYRELAYRLAEAGFVTLRFDYDGTGDSAGPGDSSGRVKAWLDSIHTAVDFIRSQHGGRVSVVGMRIGATLAAAAFGSETAVIDELVLWDPCASGRSFLREQRALSSFTVGMQSSADDDSVETPGEVFDGRTAADLSALEIQHAEGPLADAVLLLMRSGRKGDRRMNERLDRPHVTRVPIDGQEELLEVQPGLAEIPHGTIDTIVEWLAARAAGSPTIPVQISGTDRTRAIVGTTKDGPLVEETVSLGSAGLFGIITSPGWDAGALSRPTVVFCNAGVLDHVGPARLWVDLSRAWAASGFRSVRLDITGIGDSWVRGRSPHDFVYAPAALDEVQEVLRELSPDDPGDAVLVGLCSGGYQAIEGAIGARVRGLCVINPDLNFSPPEVRVDAPEDMQAGRLDTRRQASGAKKNWTRAVPALRNVLGPRVERLPDRAWWLLNRLAVESPPVRTFAKVIAGGTEVLVVVGDEERRAVFRGEGRSIRRLQQGGRFQLDVIPGLEHSLFERHGREHVQGLLTEFVFARGESAGARTTGVIT